MTIIECAEIANNFPRNKGQYLEQRLIYTLTGKIRKPDNMPFDRASDIPEFNMSVKSSHATIVAASRMNGTTKDEQMAEYFTRVKSTAFAYVADCGTAYIMDAFEFKKFLSIFVKMEKESTKNGGKYKMRLPHENRDMINWLKSLAI